MKLTDPPVSLDGDVITLLHCKHTSKHRDHELSLKHIDDMRFSDAPNGVYLVLEEQCISGTCWRFGDEQSARAKFHEVRDLIGHMTQPREPQ